MKSSTSLRLLRLTARIVVVASASFTILFLSLVLAVRLVVVPKIGDYRDEITGAIERGIGRKVAIGELVAGWDGWSPTLRLVDFSLYDQAGNQALTLPRIETSVSWRSIVAGEIRLRRLEVVGAQLLVRRDKQGHILVGGMDMEQSSEQQDPAAAEWFLKQKQVAIRDGTVVWQDEMREGIPLRLEQVNLLLANDRTRHRFGLTAVPPAALAAPLDLRGDIVIPSLSQLQKVTGRLYTRLDYLDVAQSKVWLPLPFELRSGRGAIRSWVEFAASEPSDVTIDVELDDVRTRLKSTLPELDLTHLSGRLAWRQTQGRTEIDTRALELITRNGARLTPGDVVIAHTAKTSDKPATGEIRSSQLNLEPILALVQYLPVDDKLRVRLAKFAPVGFLDSGSITWTGDSEKLHDYAVHAQFRDLGVNPVDAFPGITHLTGIVDANSKSGTLNIAAGNSRFTMPAVFAAPLEFDSLTGQFSWKVGDQVAVKVHKFSFANADTAGSVEGEYRTQAKGPGWSDLTGTIARAKPQAVHKYIPLSVGPSVRIWLRDALLGGAASDGRFVLRGNLYDFPFVDNKGGLFQVTAKATGAALDYADHWPRIENIKADLKFEGARMEINASEATSTGIALNKVHVEIPNMGVTPAHLVIRGEGGGTTEGFLRYIDQSPVGGWIDHFTQGSKAGGNGRLSLALDIPLGKYEDAKINGEFTFAGNTIQLGPEIPRVDKAGGKLIFTERDFRSQDLVAEAFGGPTNIQVSVENSKIRVGAAGTAEVAEVRKVYPFPLAERMRGRTDWQFTMQADGGNYGWIVETGLRGVTIDLPPPLAKKPEASLPLRIERQAIDKTHDRLVASLASMANLEAIRLVSETKSEVQRMAFALGRAPARADRDGLWIRGNVENIELEPWLAIANGFGGTSEKEKAPGATDIAFAGLDVTAESALAFGRRFRNIRANARNHSGSWRIELDSEDIAGTVSWQPAKAGDNGTMVARLKRLALPPEDTVPGAGGGTPATRADLPAIDLVADSYRSKGKDLGKLELKARPDGTDWQIELLALRSPESDVIASGRWRVQPSGQRTELDVKLEARDAAKFLARYGVPEGVRGGVGKLEGKLSWTGAPQDFNYDTLNGRFRLDVQHGQFTKVNPGIGKLLGVLNLEALARRLTFDFRDVVAEGYSFDEMTGDIALTNGVMNTSNLHIAGPAAKVDIAGTADIAKETQHLKIKVQPALSGGLAAAAAAATVNPIVGAGVLLGSTILRDPVGKMFAGEYDVTGSWVEPKVERLAVRPHAPGETASAQ